MSRVKQPTPRQAQALRFIRSFLHLYRVSPSFAELAWHLGVSSPAAYDLVVRMERAGLLRKKPGVSRSMVPVDMEGRFDTDQQLNAKRLVLLAFRNGPIESIHAGRPCPNCSGKRGYSRITNEEMERIMKAAVNRPIGGSPNQTVGSSPVHDGLVRRAPGAPTAEAGHDHSSSGSGWESAYCARQIRRTCRASRDC